MSSKNIFNLIIGGSGFVGSSLINCLGKNKILNLDKDQSPFYKDQTIIADITNPNDLKFPNSIKSVVLLAAEHRDDIYPVSRYYDVNVQGTKNVLNAMDASGIKNLLFTSSVAVYGLNRDNPDESSVPAPFNHYGKSKWQAELLIKEWYDNDPYNKSVTIIRPTVIFGERNRGNVYNLFKQIVNGKFVMVGKGNNKKSMAYVGNIVDFIRDKTKKLDLGYHVYNYSDKPDLSTNELVTLIRSELKLPQSNLRIPYFMGILGGYFFDIYAKIFGNSLPISSVRVKKFCATTQFNSQKAHSRFKPPFTLKQGLSRTIRHEFVKPKDDDILFFTE